MIIKNGSVFTSDGFEKKDIAFDTSHRIMAALPSADPDVFDAEAVMSFPVLSTFTHTEPLVPTFVTRISPV